MSVGRVIHQALPPGSPPPQSSHVVLGPGLVYEYEMIGVQVRDQSPPLLSKLCNIRPQLFRGVDDFF